MSRPQLCFMGGGGAGACENIVQRTAPQLCCTGGWGGRRNGGWEGVGLAQLQGHIPRCRLIYSVNRLKFQGFLGFRMFSAVGILMLVFEIQ